MNLSKRLLFLLILLFVSTMQLKAMTPIANTSQLEEQMKSFHHRMYIYFKCLPGRNKCTPEERTAAGKTILKDGAKILGALFVVGTSIFLGKNIYSEWQYQQYFKALNEATIAGEELKKIDPRFKTYDEMRNKYEKANERANALFKKLYPLPKEEQVPE